MWGRGQKGTWGANISRGCALGPPPPAGAAAAAPPAWPAVAAPPALILELYRQFDEIFLVYIYMGVSRGRHPVSTYGAPAAC